MVFVTSIFCLTNFAMILNVFSILKDQKEQIDKVISSLKDANGILHQHIPEIHIIEKLVSEIQLLFFSKIS